MHMCKELITWDKIHNLRRMKTLQRIIIKRAVYKHLQHIKKNQKDLDNTAQLKKQLNSSLT